MKPLRKVCDVLRACEGDGTLDGVVVGTYEDDARRDGHTDHRLVLLKRLGHGDEMNAQVAEHQVNDSEVHNRVGHLRAARRTQTRACATSCTSEGEPLSFPEGGGFSKTVFLSL